MLMNGYPDMQSLKEIKVDGWIWRAGNNSFRHKLILNPFKNTSVFLSNALYRLKIHETS